MTSNRELSSEIILSDKAAAAYIAQSKKPLTAIQKRTLQESQGVYELYALRWQKGVISR